MKVVVEKHPLAIRWFHWINFPVLALMIWSGLWIYWANDVYRVGWGPTTLFKFFPQSFYKAFHLDHKLARGMSWHFMLMWLFALNGLLYVGYTLVSGEWRYLLPTRHSFQAAPTPAQVQRGPANCLHQRGAHGARVAAHEAGYL